MRLFFQIGNRGLTSERVPFRTDVCVHSCCTRDRKSKSPGKRMRVRLMVRNERTHPFCKTLVRRSHSESP